MKHLNKHEQQVVTFYEVESNSYDEKRWSSSAGKRLNHFQQQLVLDSVGPCRDKQIIDIGTGTGRFALQLASQGANVIGVDIAFNMLRHANQKAQSNPVSGGLVFLQTDSTRLPFDEDSFDGCTCINVLNLIPRYEDVLAEIARVLKPNAFLVANFPNLFSVCFPGALLVNIMKRTTSRNTAGYRYSRWFRFAEIKTALSCVGIEIIDVKGQPLSPKHIALQAYPKVLQSPRLFCPSLYVIGRKRGEQLA